jgi:hypothetical protein
VLRVLRSAIVIALAVFAATACASEESSPTTGSVTVGELLTTPTVSAKKDKKRPRFTGTAAENYRINYFSCGTYSLKNLARQLHVRPDPVAVAEELASDCKPAYRQAAFEGCLDALLGRKPKVKGAP